MKARLMWLASLALASGLVMVVASPVEAEDRIFWANTGDGRSDQYAISSAALDETGGGADLVTGSAPRDFPLGTTIDARAGRIYWVNTAAFGTPTIAYAALDGSGGGTLATTGATLSQPGGLALDPVARRIYWTNLALNTISFAKLDGSGGGDLSLTGATVDQPSAVVIDPAAGRIYWSNRACDNFGCTPNGGSIAYAALDGSGGADLETGTGPLSNPFGLAIDPESRRIYWANKNGTIGYAALDGSGGGSLSTAGVGSIGDPFGVAIDPDRRLLYTPSFGRMIAVALDGSGAHLVPLTGATVDVPAFPSLIKAPVAAGSPRITGSHVPGSTVRCAGARWAADFVSSSAYRAPQSVHFGWLRNGKPVSGATGDTLTTVGQAEYQCTVTGTNAAGSRSQSSTTFRSVRNDFQVSAAVQHPRTGTATLKVTLPGPGLLTLSGKQVVTRQVEPRRAATVAVLVKARGKAARTLVAKGRVKVQATLRFSPTGGSRSTQTTRVTLRTS